MSWDEILKNFDILQNFWGLEQYFHQPIDLSEWSLQRYPVLPGPDMTVANLLILTCKDLHMNQK